MNCSAFYRLAEEEVERSAMLPGHYDDTFAAGAVWGAMVAFLTRSASDRHRRNHRNIYGKKHGVIVAKYDRASQPSSAEKPK